METREQLDNYIKTAQKNNTVLEPINRYLKLSKLEIKPFTLMRKIVTLKSIINRLFRISNRVEIVVLPTGVITEIRYFNNKRVVKVR